MARSTKMLPLSYRLVPTVLLISAFFSYVILEKVDVPKHRIKRYVVFTKSSKYFFRFNGKYNMLNFTTIFAFGYGSFRVNWDLPHNIPRRYQFFKRDIHEDIQSIPNEVVSQGMSCLISKMCDTFDRFRTLETCGFFCEIGKIVMSEQGMEGNFFKNLVNKCDYYKGICPHDEAKLIPHTEYG